MPTDIWDVAVQTNYRSSSYDNDFSSFPAETAVLAGYTTVDLLGSYRLTSKIELFARVENLFDKNYAQVAGYGTRGVGGFGGVRFKF